MVQNKHLARGRPRLYEPDVALARAMEVFWARGYAATSLDDLSEAMGMNRPSIYAAFGDKSELFRKALCRYEQDANQAIECALAPERPLRDCLRALIAALLGSFCSGGDAPRGCFMNTVAAAEATRSPEIRAVVADAVRKMESVLLARIERAREDGEIDASAKPRDLAVLATGLIHSLSIRARTGEPPAELERVVEVFLDAICGPVIALTAPAGAAKRSTPRRASRK
jgi:AcrR family transcriptional regulator